MKFTVTGSVLRRSQNKGEYVLRGFVAPYLLSFSALGSFFFSKAIGYRLRGQIKFRTGYFVLFSLSELNKFLWRSSARALFCISSTFCCLQRLNRQRKRSHFSFRWASQTSFKNKTGKRLTFSPQRARIRRSGGSYKI